MRRRVRASARESSTVVGLAAMRGQYHHDAAQIEAAALTEASLSLLTGAVVAQVRHRAKIRRRGGRPGTTVAVPKPSGETSTASIRSTIRVNDSQIDLAIGHRTRRARRNAHWLRRTNAVLRNHLLNFDV